jgi:hypothetical protein
MEYNLQHDILMRSIKMIDIGYITVLYFLTAYIFSNILDKIYDFIYNKNKNEKTKTSLACKIMVMIALSGIFSYVGRNIIERIPFPLNGYENYNHLKVKELASGVLLTTLIIQLQDNIQNNIQEFKKK